MAIAVGESIQTLTRPELGEATVPRCTILLLCYRDAPYITAAIEGALAQTVPCQIVISNDCSDDGTYELASALVAGYEGPHAVSVHRTPRNLGVAPHLNHAMAHVTGDVIVMMAGDDISYPHRVATVLQAMDENPRAMVIGSDFDAIDSDGAPAPISFRRRPERFGLDYFVSIGRLIGLLGATIAFRREVYDRFGPLEGPIEDNALSIRGALLGECMSLRSALIQYRRHPGSVSGTVFARDEPELVAFRRRYERTVAFYRGTADDLSHCLRQASDLSPNDRRVAQEILGMYQLEAEARAALIEQPRHRWLGPVLRGLQNRGLRRKSAERLLKIFLPRAWFGLRD